MRSLTATCSHFVGLLAAAAIVVGLVGCSSPPDVPTGSQDSTFGAQVTPGADPAQSEGDVGDDATSDGPMVAVDDTGTPIGTSTQGLTTNSQMRTTGNVNLRKGAATTFAIITVIPSGSTVTLLDPTAQGGFLNIQFNGTAGWSSATYLAAIATPAGTSGGGTTSGGTTGGAVDLEGATSPDNALARAKAAVGFSYYWGGGAWLDAGVSSSTAGSCSGTCPSCSHSGKYGADCSGLVAKAWQFGAKALSVDSHPYSTASFVSDSAGLWSTVSRSSLQKGDALVYNSGGHGHVALYEKGDGWGTPTVVECRGCSYGCVYNARSFASNYKGIRRAGF